MIEVDKDDIKLAAMIVADAEKDLGHRLSFGERRDLLKDNSGWSAEYVRNVVLKMPYNV